MCVCPKANVDIYCADTRADRGRDTEERRQESAAESSREARGQTCKCKVEATQTSTLTIGVSEELDLTMQKENIFDCVEKLQEETNCMCASTLVCVCVKKILNHVYA